MRESSIVELKRQFLSTNHHADFLAFLRESARLGVVPKSYHGVYLAFNGVAWLSQLERKNYDSDRRLLNGLSNQDRDIALTIVASAASFLFSLGKMQNPQLTDTAAAALQPIHKRLNGIELSQAEVVSRERTLNAVIHSPTDGFLAIEERLVSLIYSTYEIAFFAEPIESAAIAIDHLSDLCEYIDKDEKNDLAQTVRVALESYLMDFSNSSKQVKVIRYKLSHIEKHP